MMQRTLEPDGNRWTVEEKSRVAADVRRRTLFAPARQFDPNEPELMDRPDVNKAWLREELQILEKLNRLGAHRLMLGYVRQLLGLKGVGELTVLDLATGAADIPRAIVKWARDRGTKVRITAVDGN